MKYSARYILLSYLMCLCITGMAQHKVLPPKKAENKPVKKTLFPDVFFEHSLLTSGPVKLHMIDTLIKNRLVARDSAGVSYKVLGFEFTYAELGLFEDSAANLKMYTDLLTEYCPGDTVSENISKDITSRMKAGDTVMIDRVRLTGMNNTELDTIIFYGRSIKLYITR